MPLFPALAAEGQVPALQSGPLWDEVGLEGIVRARLVEEAQPLCAAVGIASPSGRTAAFVCKKPGQRIDQHTVFEVGSVAKAFAGITLDALVSGKQLGLDDPLAKWLALPADPGWRQITLRELVTHTSGLPRDAPHAEHGRSEDPYDGLDGPGLIAALAGLPSSGLKGSFAYSNVGYMLLGMAEARAAGMSYEELVRRTVFEPLGLNETALGARAGLEGRRIAGLDGALHRGTRWPVAPELAASSGMESTLADLLVFAEANLEAELKPAAQRTALEFAMVNSHAELYSGRGLSVGSGWLRATYGAKRIISITGQTGGYHAFLGFSDTEGRAVVVLVNADVDIDDLGLHLIDPHLPAKGPHLALSLEATDLAELTGSYQLRPGVTLAITVDGGHLYARVGPGRPVELVREGVDRFYARETDATLLVERDEKAQVTGVTLLQNGRPLGAPRLPLAHRPA